MQVSSCSEAPNISANATPTDNPDRMIHGREHFLSYVPTSLTDYLYQTFVTNFTSMYVRFENVTERALESECGDFPADDGSQNFECWRREGSTSNDVDFLGIDFDAVLYSNPDLQAPSQSFASFLSAVAGVNSNVSTARDFVNDIPADMRVDMQHCTVLLSQEPPTFPPVIPTTRDTIDAIPPPTTEPTTITTTTPPSGGSVSSRLRCGSLLIPLIVMALVL